MDGTTVIEASEGVAIASTNMNWQRPIPNGHRQQAVSQIGRIAMRSRWNHHAHGVRVFSFFLRVVATEGIEGIDFQGNEDEIHTHELDQNNAVIDRYFRTPWGVVISCNRLIANINRLRRQFLVWVNNGAGRFSDKFLFAAHALARLPLGAESCFLAIFGSGVDQIIRGVQVHENFVLVPNLINAGILATHVQQNQDVDH